MHAFSQEISKIKRALALDLLFAQNFFSCFRPSAWIVPFCLLNELSNLLVVLDRPAEMCRGSILALGKVDELDFRASVLPAPWSIDSQLKHNGRMHEEQLRSARARHFQTCSSGWKTPFAA